MRDTEETPITATAAPHVVNDDVRLRACLQDILNLQDGDGYGAWWASEDGIWLYQRTAERVGEPLTSWVRRVYGVRYEPLDVANTLVDVLSRTGALTATAASKEPWAYMSAILKREMRKQSGGFLRDGSLMDFVMVATPDSDDSHLTGVDEAVRLTARILDGFTPDPVRARMPAIVRYFADRGHSNLSHLHSAAARDAELLEDGWNRRQILAVANAVLGPRPNHHRASVLGEVLKDADWKPQSSTQHMAALTKYARRMSAATTPIAEES